MDGPRAPLDNEFNRVVSFLDQNLRPQGKWSITSEYPVAFSETNRGNMRIIVDNEQVLSHAVVRPMIVKTPVGLFKVGGLGSVVTSGAHRNQGLSSQIIESCIESSRAHGCDFAILWTNLYDFYRKMGFELVGSEVAILFDREINVDNMDLKFMESNKVAPEAIHRLYSQHTITTLRTLEEMRKYLQIPNSRIYTAWDQQNQLKAYAIEGKGADLDGYIHEWGGGVSALVPLLAHIRRTQNRPITVIAPKHSENLLRTLEGHKLKMNDGFLGMVKILNPSNLISKIKRHARALGVEDFVLEQQGGKYYIGAGDNVFSTDSDADIARLIFGPVRSSEFKAFDKQTAATLEKVLPLNMWVWGWDSV
ncbi:MAG TPA: GNAT family N-acetyltransferase [Bdellovibrionales bacterium]|nr:GNAT family N-acetyltransferase [Bdellovibrionales bacterium]